MTALVCSLIMFLPTSLPFPMGASGVAQLSQGQLAIKQMTASKRLVFEAITSWVTTQPFDSLATPGPCLDRIAE